MASNNDTDSAVTVVRGDGSGNGNSNCNESGNIEGSRNGIGNALNDTGMGLRW